MDTLRFVSPRAARPRTGQQIIRVSEEAYNYIEEISARTGLSIAYIASQMIKFASDRTEIVADVGIRVTGGR